MGSGSLQLCAHIRAYACTLHTHTYKYTTMILQLERTHAYASLSFLSHTYVNLSRCANLLTTLHSSSSLGITLSPPEAPASADRGPQPCLVEVCVREALLQRVGARTDNGQEGARVLESNQGRLLGNDGDRNTEGP